MALVVTPVINVGFGESGRRKKLVADLVFTSATYSSGLSVPGSSLGMSNSVDELEFVQASPADTNMYKWDAVNQKIRIYAEGAAVYAEVSGNQTVTIRISAIGW